MKRHQGTGGASSQWEQVRSKRSPVARTGPMPAKSASKAPQPAMPDTDAMQPGWLAQVQALVEGTVDIAMRMQAPAGTALRDAQAWQQVFGFACLQQLLRLAAVAAPEHFCTVDRGGWGLAYACKNEAAAKHVLPHVREAAGNLGAGTIEARFSVGSSIATALQAQLLQSSDGFLHLGHGLQATTLIGNAHVRACTITGAGGGRMPPAELEAFLKTASFPFEVLRVSQPQQRFSAADSAPAASYTAVVRYEGSLEQLPKSFLLHPDVPGSEMHLHWRNPAPTVQAGQVMRMAQDLNRFDRRAPTSPAPQRAKGPLRAPTRLPRGPARRRPLALRLAPSSEAAVPWTSVRRRMRRMCRRRHRRGLLSSPQWTPARLPPPCHMGASRPGPPPPSKWHPLGGAGAVRPPPGQHPSFALVYST